jgi:hypothetical protein
MLLLVDSNGSVLPRWIFVFSLLKENVDSPIPKHFDYVDFGILLL